MKSEILRRHADRRVTIRSTAGSRSKMTTVRLRPYVLSDPEAVAEALRDHHHKVADDWNDYLDRVARGEDPFGAK